MTDARLELSGHALDCPTKGGHVSECGWCRPWEPEDGPFHDTVLGWFDRPGGTRINCSCSVGPIHPPSAHGRFCSFEGPVLPKGRGRAWLNGGEKPREDMATWFLGPHLPPVRHTCDRSALIAGCECERIHVESFMDTLNSKARGDAAAAPLAHEDMRELLRRMRALVGEISRLLEASR